MAYISLVWGKFTYKICYLFIYKQKMLGIF